MKFKLKEFIHDKYAKAINILNDNLKGNYHALYGIRLSEVLFPTSDYGTEGFYKEFEAINAVTLPLVIFDLMDRKPIMVIGFGEVEGTHLLANSAIEVVSLDGLRDLLLNEKLIPLFD